MNISFRSLLGYFEQVLHPAGGWSDQAEKRKRKVRRSGDPLQASPDCYNIRGGMAKKQDKVRRNPAP
jgi:hypothetical protein